MKGNYSSMNTGYKRIIKSDTTWTTILPHFIYELLWVIRGESIIAHSPRWSSKITPQGPRAFASFLSQCVFEYRQKNQLQYSLPGLCLLVYERSRLKILNKD